LANTVAGVTRGSIVHGSGATVVVVVVVASVVVVAASVVVVELAGTESSSVVSSTATDVADAPTAEDSSLEPFPPPHPPTTRTKATTSDC
jgi:hypothetical protein